MKELLHISEQYNTKNESIESILIYWVIKTSYFPFKTCYLNF